MAEPRKVQFVTLSAFAAGGPAESRKRRLDDEADFNIDRDGETDGSAGEGGGGGTAGDRDKAAAERRATVRLTLSLSEPDEHSSAEFNYAELTQHLQAKKSTLSVSNPSDPFNDEEAERLQVEALAKKFENKYGNAGKKKKDRMQDLIDIGFGYDETDPFIDNSEAYDELVPASLTTKLGGFYINTGTLQFRAASDSEEEPDKILNSNKETAVRKKEVNSLEEKNLKKEKVTKQGLTPFNLHRPEKKKRKKLMKDSLYLASMLRRFTREKEEMRRTAPGVSHPGPAGHKVVPNNAPNLSSASNVARQPANVTPSDLSLADLASDPAVMSLLGSANEKELQDLLSDLDFSLLDAEQPNPTRENGILGAGAASLKGAVCVGQVRAPGSSSTGLFSPPPLPAGLPGPLIKRIEDLRAASRQFDQEGRKKFFTLDMNDILLDIELQVQDQRPETRSQIYSHLEAFVPCNKEALLKRLKKLSLNVQDDRLRTPLLKLKLAVCSVMPEQIAKYNKECMAKFAKQQSEEGDKNGSEEDDEEKPGKRVMGPRKKFFWDDKLRALLCSLVRVKLSCYEMEKQCALSVEDYLKAFLENEVKPLWPKGWMQTRILFKESITVHHHLTANVVKRRVVTGPKAKNKECLWIHKPPLGVTSTPSLPTSTSAHPVGRPLLLPPSPSEPICLSDSLDEDLTAPSLDSISHALALLTNASRGLGPIDSPLSPPPLQMPTSSPPPVAPHYPSASAQQHSHPEATPTSAGGQPPTTNVPTTSCSPRVPPPQRTADAHFAAQLKGAGQPQTHRLVTMASSNHRAGSALGKMPPHSSATAPLKQQPPPTVSPLLSPHQKVFSGPVGVAPGLVKKSSSNGSAAAPPSSSPSPLPRSAPPPLGPPSSASVSSGTPTSSSQIKSQSQPNFITPMQATLTRPPHSGSTSPIIKLTPRPPAPTPPPASSPSSLPSQPLPHQVLPHQQQQHSYPPKNPKSFRPPFSAPGSTQGKQTQPGGVFTGGHKPQAASGSKAPPTTACNPADKSTAPPTGPPAPQRQRVGPGAKAGNGWATSGTLTSTSTTSHLPQGSGAGPPLHSALPLGFGMLGGLVPVSLPFQFPPLINFSAAGASGAGGMSSAPAPNSGFQLAQSDLMDLYKSLQSGSQAALPPHLQLAFSESNQSSSGDMKRKPH